MKKRVCSVLLSLLLTLLLALGIASPALAATRQEANLYATTSQLVLSHSKPRWYRSRSPLWRTQINNQHEQDCLINSGNKTYRGSSQGNSGNSHDNGGFNQDNSSNLGNQIIHRRDLREHRRNNQFLRSCSFNSSNLYYQGHNQGNSGNSGYNHGYNQDDSGNNGNQIIN